MSQLELRRLTDAPFNQLINNDSMTRAGRLSANKVDSAYGDSLNFRSRLEMIIFFL